MSNERFTQGEWSVEDNAYDEFTVSSDGEALAFTIEGYTNINKEANAHLISAAPDMYRALRELEPLNEKQYRKLMKEASCHNGICSIDECIRCKRHLQAIKALAKADGE